ncbi:MAG: sulfite exporter TauE/SafE family protein [Candidatus Roizmanbacteria bacterium]|nr:MAG: sulfite exporter TauE/SafE family protein [Candidatus Roizmanbacteria bacterium]
MTDIKKTTVHIKGMHCPSCDILIQDKFAEVDNVKKVKANFRTQKTEVYYTGHLNHHTLNRKIIQYGYAILEKGEREETEPYLNRVFNAGAIAVIFFILYFFAQELNLLPEFNTAAGLTLSTVFILGLIASTSTCMATSGALFLATIGKLKKTGVSVTENIIPALSFNVGRVLTYTVFGFLTGFVGKTLSNNFQLGSILSLFVAVMMVVVGLNMLKLIQFSSVISTSFTKGIFQKLEHKLLLHPKKTSFFLGAITYLLPCGFTQTVQLYALGQADPVKSALTMGIFALGTVPMLMVIGLASAFTKSKYYAVFYRVVGVVILLVGLSYFSNFLALQGISFPGFSASASGSSTVEIKNGYQIATMNVNSSGYSPNLFTVKSKVPVRWVIKGQNVFGCQGFLVVPKLGVQKLLERGDNIIEFTPEEIGRISFSCGMGMYRGSFDVI